MHSQLRSAPSHQRENDQDPIDLSQYHVLRPTPKMATRSNGLPTTSTTTAATASALRTVPILTSSITEPTHTIYSNAVPSSSTTTTTKLISSEETTIRSSFVIERERRD
jgi:hypothetical protein